MSNELSTRSQFQSVEPVMIQAGFTPERVRQEISFAIQHINKSKQLQECTNESRLTAVLNVSNIGLSLNPAVKEAYLIPRWNNLKKSFECVLEPGYVGLVKLLTDAGAIKSMVCQLVYAGDKFSINLADNHNPVYHNPELSRSKRGEIIGCYALATLPDGNRQVEWMDAEDINAIRERSETYKAFKEGKIKSCTWATDWGEMARKTVIRRIYKYLPRTDRMTAIDKAIEVDTVDYTASNEQIAYIENLLRTSTLEQHQRDDIEMELSVMNGQRASEVIEMLKANQQLGDKELLKRMQKQPA